MTGTKPANDGKFINYAGKVKGKYRNYGIPEEVALGAPYFKDLILQTINDYQDDYDEIWKGTEEKFVLEIFERIRGNTNPDTGKEYTVQDALLIAETYKTENPDAYDSMIRRTIEKGRARELQPFIASGEVHHKINYVGNSFELGQYLMGSGKQKKLYYTSLQANVRSLVAVSPRDSNVLRFIGLPGTGKTNGGIVLTEEGLLMNYWAYTNLPLVPYRNGQIYTNAHVIESVSDLLIDSDTIPSMLRVKILARKLHQTIGLIYLRDERGRGMERYAQSKEVTTEASSQQIRRHFLATLISLGVLDDTGEVKNMQTHQIETMARETGKWRKGEPEKEYHWVIRKKRDDSDKFHDETRVYGIPEPRFVKVQWNNVFELPNPVIPDCSLDDFFSSMENANLSDEEMVNAGREFALTAKEAYLEWLAGKKGDKDTEKDKKKTDHMGYCYDCELIFSTIQDRTQPTCPSCHNVNTTVQGPVIVAVIKRFKEQKGLDRKEIDLEVEKFGRKKSIDLS